MQEGSQRASAGCASLHGIAPIFIGAWKDVMRIDGGGGEIRYGKLSFFFPFSPMQPAHVQRC